MAAAPPDLPSLPEVVEEQLQAICRHFSKPPPDAIARRLLSEVGEAESLRILSIIRNSSKVSNLAGFIVHLTKNSRSPPSRSPLPTSLAITPQENATRDQKRKREPDCSGGGSSVRRVVIYDSPTKVNEEPGVPKSETDCPGEGSSVERVVNCNSLSKIEERSEPELPKNKRDIVLDALEKLEFRKAFLLLNYLGCSKLEDEVSAEDILSYQRLAMREFESEIWIRFGRFKCQEKERVIKINWETGERYYYHCHVDGEGNCCYKGPFLNKAATLLQKTVGDENVLIVKFIVQESKSNGRNSVLQTPVFNKVFEEGILVGRKCYRFFVFKDGGKVKNKKDPSSSPLKCYFVCMEGFSSLLGKPSHQLKDMAVQEARGLFMHIHNATSLSNYMARFSLILSKTITLELDFNDVHVEIVDDEPCRDEDGEVVYDKDGKALILTDGTGFISEDLALKCHNCFNGCVNSENNFQDLLKSLEALQYPRNLGMSELKSLPGVPPLLIQFRMFHEGRAIKGTVLVNKKLPPSTILVRKSMLKIASNEIPSGAPTVNSFEVVATSNKPNVAKLSKNLIALLHFGGVPRHVFLELLWEALEKPLSPLYKIKPAVKAAVDWDFTDEFIAARMIASGIPLDEPYLQHCLSKIAKDEMKGLKGGKLPVSDSYYVMGTADPTQTLNSGEVCIILEHGQLSGPVLVYRNPGIHPGDVHVVNARYVEALGDFVGNSKYGIFFPSKGPRSMGDEIAGGDYDGDMYWVSTNAKLLKYFRPSEPWTCANSPIIINKNASLPSDEALERDLFRYYLATNFSPSKAMGIAADSWLTYMDRMLTLGDDNADEKAALRQKIDELIDIYYDALDAPKKGRKVEVPKGLIPDQYPHFMGRGEHCTYISKSILGEIHDIVDQLSAPIKFWKLEYFDVEIPEEHLKQWKQRYDNYRLEMLKTLNGSGNTDVVYQKYQKLLYGGVNELDSSKAWKDIRLEALAIYHVCYNHAERVADPKKCGFAWKVAGDALWKIVLLSKGEKPILFAPSVLSQMMR